MIARIWILLWVLCAGAVAQSDAGSAGAVTPPGQVITKPQRLAMLAFQFDPDGGVIKVQILEPDGAKRFALDSIGISAIGEGRTIPAALDRVDASSFKGTLNLSEGVWNVIVRAAQGEQRLEGQYALGVGGSIATGRVPLVPPNPEVGRLTWIVGLMFGVPLGLAALVVLTAVIFKQFGPKPSAV